MNPASAPTTDHGRIVSESSSCLDSLQLDQLEREFTAWAESARRTDVTLSRKRVVLIFLLIRHTGAKLNEVARLNPHRDIDHVRLLVTYGSSEDGPRTVPISAALSQKIRDMLADLALHDTVVHGLGVDPGFIRRKFYDRAEACGFPKQLGAPEMIRKSRGVELMQSNMPLPAVQLYLGHSTPNLTSAYVSFSKDEIRAITTSFLERETRRATSARNAFFGKITAVRPGDIQATVRLRTMDGLEVAAIITQDSLDRLGLKPGRLASVEVKAPWITIHAGQAEPLCSAENRFQGTVLSIRRGQINSEYSLRITDTTTLCALVGTENLDRLDLRVGDRAWAVFNSHAAVLHVDA
jgi:molybdate transport system regulatory protein